LGSGLDAPAVHGNRSLAEEISRAGAIVTEFPFGIPPEPRNFPQRNRLISGLARAVVVVEAAERSGSLITARHALEQGRDLFAVPGPAGDPVRRGSHELLRRGAYLCENADDILNVLVPQFAHAGAPSKVSVKVDSDVADLEILVFSALGVDPRDIDTIARRSQTTPGRTAAALARLELQGLARQFTGKRFSRLE
ncbi:MAG: DNA-processing protein DprA, partial [Vicinamibacteria bacterium]